MEFSASRLAPSNGRKGLPCNRKIGLHESQLLIVIAFFFSTMKEKDICIYLTRLSPVSNVELFKRKLGIKAGNWTELSS